MGLAARRRIWALGGLLMVALSAGSFVWAKQYLADSVVAKARVLSILSENGVCEGFAQIDHGCTHFTAKLRMKVDDVPNDFMLEAGTAPKPGASPNNHATLYQGQVVPVRYRAGDPSQVRVDSTLSIWGYSIGFLGIAGFCFVFALLGVDLDDLT